MTIKIPLGHLQLKVLSNKQLKKLPQGSVVYGVKKNQHYPDKRGIVQPLRYFKKDEFYIQDIDCGGNFSNDDTYEDPFCREDFNEIFLIEHDTFIAHYNFFNFSFLRFASDYIIELLALEEKHE